MAYRYDKELAPVFRVEALEDKKFRQEKQSPLRAVFNKRNLFVGMQLLATTFLSVSGALSGNDGRMWTGIGNTTKNGSWLAFNALSHKNSSNPFERDQNGTKANGYGAAVSALTNTPQFAMNLAPVFAGAVAGVAWGDVIGAAAGIAAYSLMALDQYIEHRRLKKTEKLGNEIFPENPEIWHAYDESRRDLAVGYDERGHHFQEFVFNKLPSLLLISRGLAFTATGVAAAAASFTLPAVLMVGAGVLFTAGAASELHRQVDEPLPLPDEDTSISDVISEIVDDDDSDEDDFNQKKSGSNEVEEGHLLKRDQNVSKGIDFSLSVANLDTDDTALRISLQNRDAIDFHVLPGLDNS